MATMNISLPDKLKEYVEARVAEGNYSNVSDYVRDVIRMEQERMEYLVKIQTALSVGDKSGLSTRNIEDILHNARGLKKSA